MGRLLCPPYSSSANLRPVLERMGCFRKEGGGRVLTVCPVTSSTSIFPSFLSLSAMAADVRLSWGVNVNSRPSISCEGGEGSRCHQTWPAHTSE
jgi:hypothetical protein